MARFRGLVLAGLLFCGLERAAQAQLVASDPNGYWSASYGYFYGNEPYGGFGLEYSQPLRDGSLIMDRFGMVYVVSVPQTVQPETPAPAPASTRRSPRVRQSRSDATPTQAQPRYQMPTGSLEWSGANGGILYSPATRYQSYGGGYAGNPYGAIDHSVMYKGWALGY